MVNHATPAAGSPQFDDLALALSTQLTRFTPSPAKTQPVIDAFVSVFELTSWKPLEPHQHSDYWSYAVQIDTPKFSQARLAIGVPADRSDVLVALAHTPQIITVDEHERNVLGGLSLRFLRSRNLGRFSQDVWIRRPFSEKPEYYVRELFSLLQVERAYAEFAAYQEERKRTPEQVAQTLYEKIKNG